ncbi:hypothetical protein HHI36_020505 [Cryptolaemus montrouzieri]|uniref:SH2 domain-containing protein n=1 Tax=Cryptolaemus montrouzieri TaxID=559131 RepID=A0ABD2NAG7_9CUCU
MGLRWCCCFCPRKISADRRGRNTSRSLQNKYDDRHSLERKSLREKEESQMSYSISFPREFKYDATSSVPVKIPDPLTTYNWYYGTITRFQAHELLKNEEDGIFLVRKSSDVKTEYPYIISVKQSLPEGATGKENYHYRIRKDENGYFTLGSNLYFKTVMDLIEYYKGKTDSLKVTLKAYIDHTQPIR